MSIQTRICSPRRVGISRTRKNSWRAKEVNQTLSGLTSEHHLPGAPFPPFSWRTPHHSELAGMPLPERTPVIWSFLISDIFVPVPGTMLLKPFECPK